MSIAELQKIIISETPLTEYNDIQSPKQVFYATENIYPILEQCITRYFDPDIQPITKQELLQLIEILVSNYKIIKNNLSYSTNIIHAILSKYNKTDNTHLKLINILLPFFPETKVTSHLPYEIEPNRGNVYKVNYLYYMGIRPKPVTASVLNVKLLEAFISHNHDVLAPVNILYSDNEKKQPAMQDNLLALSIRTHNMNILHPTNISYHITKYLIYNISQNKNHVINTLHQGCGTVTQYLDNVPNPFILGLITLPIRYTVTQENHIFNFILLLNYLAKVYDLINTEPILFTYLITNFNNTSFQYSFHSIMKQLDIIPFLINSQSHVYIQECRPESYFPGIYNRNELLEYFIEFMETKESPKKKESQNSMPSQPQYLTD